MDPGPTFEAINCMVLCVHPAQLQVFLPWRERKHLRKPKATDLRWNMFGVVGSSLHISDIIKHDYIDILWYIPGQYCWCEGDINYLLIKPIHKDLSIGTHRQLIIDNMFVIIGGSKDHGRIYSFTIYFYRKFPFHYLWGLKSKGNST